MFKKKPQIKSLSPLRSSDRRKIADQIIAQYNVSIPAPAQPSTDAPQPSTSTEPTLSQIRASLLPENTSSARFSTTHGPNLATLNGTVYIGSHPSSPDTQQILWFKLNNNDENARLYPTVYTLWQNPGLVPLLHTHGIVMDKMRSGADLMTPGLTLGPPFASGAKTGAVVGVASADSPSVPIWIGTCEIDVCKLGRVQGMKGVAVTGVQWVGDEVWNWSAVSGEKGGIEPPERIEGWERADEDEELAGGVGGLEIEEEGGVALSAEETGEVEEVEDAAAAPEEAVEPTTKEIDEAIEQAFLYAIHHYKEAHPPPQHGLPFPIQPSFLIASMITPFLRIQDQPQFYQIKKTSWKNVKKFIKHLDKTGLLKSKDRNGGECVILDIDFEDAAIREFKPYKLPSPAKNGDSNASSGQTSTTNGSISSNIQIQTLYRPSQKLIPELFPKEPSYHTASALTTYIKSYIDNSSPPLTHPTNKRLVTLNPFLSNTVLGTNSSTDTAMLARGTVPRDTLTKRILEDTHLCAPYWLLLRDGQTYPDPSNPSLKPKAGSPPRITLTIEKRTGNKMVTRIVGLEVFGIVPATLAEELSKKCACSTSTAQAVGAAKGVMEVLVQGDQRKIVGGVLEKRGVAARFVEVVDKGKGKKK